MAEEKKKKHSEMTVAELIDAQKAALKKKKAAQKKELENKKIKMDRKLAAVVREWCPDKSDDELINSFRALIAERKQAE